MTASPLPNPNRPPRIPMDQAFTEAAAIVRNGLESLNIRWSPEAEQDAVSTLLIQAGKAGFLLPWNPPAEIHPAQPKNMPVVPLSRPVAQSDEHLGLLLAESIRQAERRRNPPASFPARATSEGAAAPADRLKAFPTMIRAFREIEIDLPPEVWRAVLEWHGVSQPEDFRPDQVNQAAACYIALKTARNQYRADQQITSEHFEAVEEGWR